MEGEKSGKEHPKWKHYKSSLLRDQSLPFVCCSALRDPKSEISANRSICLKLSLWGGKKATRQLSGRISVTVTPHKLSICLQSPQPANALMLIAQQIAIIWSKSKALGSAQGMLGQSRAPSWHPAAPLWPSHSHTAGTVGELVWSNIHCQKSH